MENLLDRVAMTTCKISWRVKNKEGYALCDYRYYGGYHFYHRYVYARYHKVDLKSTDVIRHTCDMPACYEITHLIKGTQADNMADMRSKNRQPKGSDFNKSNLTDVIVLEIRRQYATGLITQQELSDKFGTSRRNIGYIVNKKVWKHV